MIRDVSTTILTASGAAREGLRVDFYADDPADNTQATTDASGVFVASLVTGVTYHIPTSNPFIVAGVPFPAGVMFVVNVPEAEGPTTLAEVVVGIIDMSPAALHTRLLAIESAIALQSPQVVSIAVPDESESL